MIKRKSIKFAEDLDFLLLDKETLRRRDAKNQPDIMYQKRKTRRIVKRIINTLPKRDREIMNKYYYDGITMQEIGENYNLSRQRIHQIIKKNLRILRRKIKRKK